MSRGRIIWHPFLLAVYLVVGAYLEVKPLADAGEAFRLVPVLLLAAGVLAGVLMLVVRDARKAALLTTVLLLYLGLGGEVTITFSAWVKGTRWAFLAQGSTLVLVLSGITALLAWMVVRTKRDLTALTRAFHAGMTALVLLSILTPLADGRDREFRAYMKSRSGPVLKVPPRPPDIYYIVLDCCASVASMRTDFNYDPARDLDFLAANGFQIVTNARSEFKDTPLSLATSLNMQAPPRNVVEDGSRHGINAQVRLMRDGMVPTLLQAAGYDMVNLSMTPLKETPARYDFPAALSFVTVRNAVYNRSIVSKIPALDKRIKGTAGVSRRALKRLQPLAGLEAVIRERSSKPRFVFCHVMLPHPPYYFRQDGQVRKMKWNEPGTAKDYREQLVFTIRKIVSMAGLILKEGYGDPVIVIQGDHGYRDPNSPDLKDDVVAHSVFFAYRCPGVQRVRAWEGIFCADFFRVVLNQVFQAELPYTPGTLGDASDAARVAP